MGNISTTPSSEKTLRGSCAGDFGVREERYRININRKIRSLTRQMEQSSTGEYLICDPIKYQSMLLKMKERINERS